MGHRGIVGTARSKHVVHAATLVEGHHGDVATLQVAHRQHIVVVTQHGDAAGTQLAMQGLTLTIVQVAHDARGFDKLHAAKAQGILVAQQASAVVVDSLLRERASVHGSHDGIEFGLHVAWHEQHVVAGKQGVDTRRALQGLSGALHGECIGEYQSLEAQLVAQQLGDTRRRHRAGHHAVVDGWHTQVRSEHAA